MNSNVVSGFKYAPAKALEKVCRILLYALVSTLVFEGLVRKLLPSSIGIVVFFLKDILCIIAFFITYGKVTSSLIFSIKQKWVWVSVAFIPLLILALVLDPPLSAFAAKQYLLYTVVVLLVQYSFFNNSYSYLKTFLFCFSIFLLITSGVAILQNSLPGSSWLNLSVNGDSLENFSAGGYLRVSSTFSFTGQYSWFLNVACPLLITYIVISAITTKRVSIIQFVYWIVLSVAFIISIFVTGGRTAVIGAGGTVVIGFFFLLLKRPLWVLSTGIFIMMGILLLLSALEAYKPEYFAAYEQRSSGSETQTHEQEVQERIQGGLTDWTTWFWKEDFANIIMGNGLGVMSNGSEQLSSYARDIKKSGFWTETDTATIFWEGGLYLAVIWYAFRFFIILMCFRLYWSFKEKRLNFAGAFLLSYILITGTIGTLSIQPPIAIWWWLSVGIMLSLKYNEKGLLQLKNKISYRNQIKNRMILPDAHAQQVFRP